MIWFTSDTHFGHAKIIEFCKRPFPSVEQMDNSLVELWNSRVRPGDEVYHIGDFAFGNKVFCESILAKLCGNKHLVRGNHDVQASKANGWASVMDYDEVMVSKDIPRVVLSHYAMRVWNKKHYGSAMLYGHSHGTLPGSSQSTDVGVDCWEYSPVSFDSIVSRLSTLPPAECDYHEDRRVNK